MSDDTMTQDTPSDATDAAKARKALDRLEIDALPFDNLHVSVAWHKDYRLVRAFIAAAEAQAAELAALREREQRMCEVLDDLAKIYPYLDNVRHVWVCSVCAGENPLLREIQHFNDCLVMAARALLAEGEAGA